MLAPYWLFALGGLFIFVTLFLPKGIVGTAGEWIARLHFSGRRAPANGSLPPDAARQPAE
jgi:urea transport system permease protein